MRGVTLFITTIHKTKKNVIFFYKNAWEITVADINYGLKLSLIIL